MSDTSRFSYEAMMTMANRLANLEKKVKELEAQLSHTANDASYAASMVRPIGSSHP